MDRINDIIDNYLSKAAGREITQRKIRHDYNSVNSEFPLSRVYCASIFRTLCERNILKKVAVGIYRVHADPVNEAPPVNTIRSKVLTMIPTELPGITVPQLVKMYSMVYEPIKENYIRQILYTYLEDGTLKRPYRGVYIKKPVFPSAIPAPAPTAGPAPAPAPPAPQII